LSLDQNFYLKFSDKKIPIYFSRQILDQYFYQETKLGATWSGEKGQEVFLKLWSPPGAKVSVLFWLKRKLIETLPMEKSENGIWQKKITAQSLKLKTLEGLAYQYQVTACEYCA
jgi:hypothetical protein